MSTPKPTAHATVKAVCTKGVLKLDDEAAYKAAIRRLQLGEGEAVVIRVEREADAYTYQALKHYWGFIVTPVSEHTGYHKQEVHQLLKAECLVEGKTSITELSGEEFQLYREAAEQTARTWCPEAFALADRRFA